MNRAHLLLVSVLLAQPALGSVLLKESFDDASLAARGWYDNPSQTISTTQHIAGSKGALAYRFRSGAILPDSGGAMRHLFPPSDSVYLRYYVKYSDNWEGSNTYYHPHEFSFLTNKDGAWIGPAESHLTTYIEQNEGRLRFAIQDTLNINQSKVGVNLTQSTESRGVSGCNGNTDGYHESCYQFGGHYRNEKDWASPTVNFLDSRGPNYKGDWHKVEVYFQLNSVVNGKGVPDGRFTYWFDGKMLMNYEKVLFRTGQHADMKVNQLIIAPYIGVGSPVDQSFWIDDLLLANHRMAPPSAPQLSGVR